MRDKEENREIPAFQNVGLIGEISNQEVQRLDFVLKLLALYSEHSFYSDTMSLFFQYRQNFAKINSVIIFSRIIFLN